MDIDFIFYTSEGHSIAPNGCELDSLQILGFERGTCYNEALSKLMNNNPWIVKSGFDIKQILHKVFITDSFMQEIKTMVDCI